MPYEVTVDHQTRTIVVRGSGQATTADTLRLIEGQHETFRAHPGYDFLYDSRKLEIESSPQDMLTVANALFTEAQATFRRFAIVIPEKRAHLARIFTALADPYDIDANAFTDEADAWEWLRGG